MPSTTPEPIRRYLSGESSLDEAVQEMQHLSGGGGFNFPAMDFTPAELIKVMEFIRAYSMAASPEEAAIAKDLTPEQMATIFEEMRKNPPKHPGFQPPS